MWGLLNGGWAEMWMCEFIVRSERTEFSLCHVLSIKDTGNALMATFSSVPTNDYQQPPTWPWRDPFSSPAPTDVAVSSSRFLALTSKQTVAWQQRSLQGSCRWARSTSSASITREFSSSSATTTWTGKEDRWTYKTSTDSSRTWSTSPPKVLLLCRSWGACVPCRSQRLRQLEFRLLVGTTMLDRLWARGQTKCNTPLMLATSVFGRILRRPCYVMAQPKSRLDIPWPNDAECMGHVWYHFSCWYPLLFDVESLAGCVGG